MNTGNTFEYLTALVAAAEHNARLRENAFCNNIKMEPPTGEVAYRCMKPVEEIELGFCDECLERNPELREE